MAQVINQRKTFCRRSGYKRATVRPAGARHNSTIYTTDQMSYWTIDAYGFSHGY